MRTEVSVQRQDGEAQSDPHLSNPPMTPEESLAEAERVIRSIVASRYDRPSLVASIASEVGAEIVEGCIPPGHDLNTVELSKQYKTSRTPVREALILLEAEGLVEIPPRKRPRAKVHTIEEVREVYRTRAALLAFVAGEVAKLADEKDIATLRGVLEEMSAASQRDDIRAYIWLSVKFNDYNTQIARNSTVKRIIDSLLLRTLAIRRLNLSQPSRFEQSLADHIRLVDAYENHDSYLAAAILRANHVAALATVESYYKQTDSLVFKL
jgi:DNA-binding GntR family transcriptional regulator